MFICFVCIAACMACGPQKPTNAQVIDEFASIECRAITLRQQRFALANKIRFAEDILTNAATVADSTSIISQLQTMLTQKLWLANQSIAVADTIKKKLDTIMQVHFTDALQRQKFTGRLAKKLKQMGCNETE